VIRGTIILESLREEAELTGFRSLVREVGRGRARLSEQQIAAGLPDVWCSIEFELEDERADDLTEALSEALDTGWYANFSSETETFIIFSGRVFRYPRGQRDGRAEAQAYGRALGIPERQLDWSE